MNKNRKILEMQTIQLIQENKKDEQKDTWLLSKKPFGGHLCASCESYIGELNPTTSERFIPWNKYPPKESREKTYKIEGGNISLPCSSNLAINISLPYSSNSCL